MKLLINTLVISVFMPLICSGQILFEDSFEGNLSDWEINNDGSVEIIDSQDPNQGKVLVMTPNGNVTALIKNYLSVARKSQSINCGKTNTMRIEEKIYCELY